MKTKDTSRTPILSKKHKDIMIVALQLLFIASVEFGPGLLAISSMDDLNTNPTNDSTFGKLWENVSLGWKIFQAVMALIGGIAIYIGCTKIKKRDWGEVIGYIATGLGIAIGPGIYKWVMYRASQL